MCNRTSLCFIGALLLAATTHAFADGIRFSHGTANLQPLKYPPDFTHFAWVNPEAPKGGTIRAAEMGTFDSFNGILDKGRVAAGTARSGLHALIYASLLEQAHDESAAFYGRLAEGIWVAEDYRRFAIRLRDAAHWHDGKPVTVEDVIWTFDTLREKGAAGVRTALRELGSVEQIGPREILFATREGAQSNPDLVYVVGSYSILPKHYWADRDVTKTTVQPPLGSGPYRIGEYSIGRNLVLERVEDYWGQDLPVMRGRFNFDEIKFDYFRDESVMLESQKGDVIDVRTETVSKNWMTAYTFPAVKAGYFKRELVDISRPWGLWAPVIWNLDINKFQDIRVREALWLMSEFRWTNRVLMYGFYNYAKSYFYNSPMASEGMPSAKELELLEPWRGQIPDRVFTEEWTGNETSGYGFSRDNAKRALALFSEAGWEIQNGVMTNIETREPFEIDFIFGSPFGLRQELPFMAWLNRIGIHTTARAMETSNWLYRMRNGKFDASQMGFTASNVPGIMLRNRLSTSAADSDGGQNWGNIRNPAVDAMIEHVMAARDIDDFYSATRALDRILLWSHYYVPGLGAPGYRLVYWDRFGQPENPPRLLRPAWLDTWWWDEAKARRVAEGMAALPGK